MVKMPREWRPSFAGAWYPSDTGELQRLVKQYDRTSESDREMDSRVSRANSVPNVLVLPHAGLQFSARGQMAGWRTIAPARIADIEHVLIIAPSHYQRFPDNKTVGALFDRYVLAPLAFPGAPSIGTSESPDAILREHAVELMLPIAALFFADASRAPRVTAIILSAIESRDELLAMAADLQRRIEDWIDPATTLILVSSDFTHYGRRFNYAPFGSGPAAETLPAVQAVDLEVAGAAAAREIERYWDLITTRKTTICGRYALALAMALLDGFDPHHTAVGRVLDYYSSVDVAGNGRDRDYVCYATIAYGAAS